MFEHEQDFSFNFKRLFVPLTKKKAILIIATLGSIIFLISLFNGFVWDDIVFILNNPQVHQLNLPELLGSNLFNSGAFYRPIPAIYFAVLYSFFGQQAFFYHFLQVSLHIIDAIFVYLLLSSLLDITKKTNEEDEKKWNSLSGSQRVKRMRMYGSAGTSANVPDGTANTLSLFLSLIFLVHPINVESVAYIGAGTPSELYFLPGISAFLLAHRKNVPGKKFMLIIGLLLVSVLAKETGFLFLFLIVIYRHLFKLNRLKEFIGAGLGISVVYAFFRIFLGGVTYNSPEKISPISALPFLQRIINIPAIIMYYVKTFLFPLHLIVWQLWFTKIMTATGFILPLILCLLFFALLSGATIYFYKKEKSVYKEFLFFFFWFTIGIALLLQIVPLDLTVADRWFYFPIVGALGMIGVGLKELKPIYQRRQKLFYVIAIVLLGFLSLRTLVRTFDWMDNITLFTHDIKEGGDIYDGNYHIFYNLGNAYSQKKQYTAALAAYNKSIAINPHYALTYVNMSDVYYSQHKYNLAEQALKKAVKLEPNSVNYLTDLALIDTYDNRIQDALLQYQKALKLSPDDPVLKTNYAILLKTHASSAADTPAPSIALTAPPGWKPFANTAMNIGFVYPSSLQLTQKDTQTVALSDLSHKKETEEMLIYSTTGITTDNLKLPFPVTGSLLETQPVKLPGFTARMKIYASSVGVPEQLLFMQKNQQIFVIRFPANKAIDPSIVNDLVNSIITLH